MRFQRSLGAAAAAALSIVAVAATALGASPKRNGEFKGTLLDYRTGNLTGPIKFGKFRAPVSFRVSSAGTQLIGFNYGYTGCFGAGGFGNKDPYTFPGEIKHFGPISVSAGGSFSAPATKSTDKGSGGTGKAKFTSVLTTMSSLTGKFTSVTKASGTIVFTQRDVYNGGKPTTCGPVSLTFAAKAG
ncbi:MAG TPA: hypothetical protein VIJ20_12015 [Solirubrobacteraceae bacterium]